ncbi:hypothetical protein [Gorillibacterium massiliense]|uniref:hypothetical protein n=1 Tax=Gorillibacterium massiliense TaxID=1280390 RepID=UPI0004BA8560|nr:hypothetical protein [Gorillibacterium massiliense]
MDDSMKQFVRISVNRMMEHYAPKLIQSLEPLKLEELWLHEYVHMNAIGGIVLHICEHVNRHTVRYARSGENGTGDQFQAENGSNAGLAETQAMYFELKLATAGGGIENYFPDKMLSGVELIEQVTKSFRMWQDVTMTYVKKDLPNHTLNMNDIYHLVEHTGYHLGQIVDRSQRISQRSFQFMQNGISEQALKEILDKSG